MTLTRRMALFIASLLLLALGGALVIHTLAAKDVLQQQQDLRNRDSAASLALALTQQKGDLSAMTAVAPAQFDLGHYRHIALTNAQGQALINLESATVAPNTPGWFGALLPMDAAPGRAVVSSGWHELGTLTVAAHTSWSQEALWSASLHSASLLAVLAVLAALLTAFMLRAWQRPLQATVLQAQALARGQFIESPLPRLPELQELTNSMNTTVRRLRETFAGQAEQVAYLQRQAQLDSLTLLPMRQQLVEHLDRRLNQQDALGLLLVRVTPLEHINETHGRNAADNVLRQVGAVLARFSNAEPDSFAARLNGPDLALLLPLPSMAAITAPTLLRALTEAVAPLNVDAQVSVAASMALPNETADATLTNALSGLQTATANNGLYVDKPTPLGQTSVDTAATQAQIAAALNEHRAQIGHYPVLDSVGQLIHLECPLRLQLILGGPYLSASKWLPSARRSGLSPMVDLAAIRLALAGCAQDNKPRAVNVELSSLTDSGFVEEVGQSLAAQPQAAALLWVEWVETERCSDWNAAVRATRQWRSLGVRLGVEHAGGAPEQLAALRDLGLDYVKVDARHLRGVAGDARVRAYARSLSGLIRLLGLKVLAEGVDNNEDLEALWRMGFDGATGRALRLPSASEPTASPATNAVST
jgi:EAL domain-containing protein (putative c-di-GMP-specific phosphodiesterase class I)/GGDEF domain-containing protein